jgi:hypothetical protein
LVKPAIVVILWHAIVIKSLAFARRASPPEPECVSLRASCLTTAPFRGWLTQFPITEAAPAMLASRVCANNTGPPFCANICSLQVLFLTPQLKKSPPEGGLLFPPYRGPAGHRGFLAEGVHVLAAAPAIYD